MSNLQDAIQHVKDARESVAAILAKLDEVLKNVGGEAAPVNSEPKATTPTSWQSDTQPDPEATQKVPMVTTGDVGA